MKLKLSLLLPIFALISCQIQAGIISRGVGAAYTIMGGVLLNEIWQLTPSPSKKPITLKFEQEYKSDNDYRKARLGISLFPSIGIEKKIYTLGILHDHQRYGIWFDQKNHKQNKPEAKAILSVAPAILLMKGLAKLL